MYHQEFVSPNMSKRKNKTKQKQNGYKFLNIYCARSLVFVSPYRDGTKLNVPSRKKNLLLFFSGKFCVMSSVILSRKQPNILLQVKITELRFCYSSMDKFIFVDEYLCNFVRRIDESLWPRRDTLTNVFYRVIYF